MHGNTLETRDESKWFGDKTDTETVVELTDTGIVDRGNSHQRRSGFFRLVAELRRRKVCRAATAYCIALWLTCQIVEVVSPALGLPDWTLEFVIVLGLVGFPIALILAWLFEVTPGGLVLDDETGRQTVDVRQDVPRSRFDQVIDCSLLLVAIVIGAELALTSIGSNLYASSVRTQELYIGQFPVVSEIGSEAYSSALQVELQYEIARLPAFKVLVPTNPKKLYSGSILTGSASVTDEEIQVTAIVVNNKTGELGWSEVLRFPVKETGRAPRSVAKGIAMALESWSTEAFESGDQNE